MGTKADLEIATTTLAARGYLKLPVPPKDKIVSEIKRLKMEKNAVILAHYYQNKEIQELADYLGDSCI